MTGKLAFLGVALVLSASVFAGLVNSSPTEESLRDEIAATATVEQGGDPEADDESEDPAEPPPAEETPAPVTNRENCDEIRGTDYLSPDERTWFLANCVN